MQGMRLVQPAPVDGAFSPLESDGYDGFEDSPSGYDSGLVDGYSSRTPRPPPSRHGATSPSSRSGTPSTRAATATPRRPRSEQELRQMVLKPPLSMRKAMGLPRVPGSRSASVDPGAGVRRPDSIPELPDEGQQSQSMTFSDTAVSEGRLVPVEVTAAQKGVNHIGDLISWMRPRKFDGGFLSTMARLSIEVDQAAQEWSIYRGGLCNRKAALEATAGKERPPLDPLRTAKAASLLLRLTRSLPLDLSLRTMLEPLVQEVLEAVYRDWPSYPSLEEFNEVELLPEWLAQLAAYFSLVGGHKAQSEQASARFSAATSEIETLRKRISPVEEELQEERRQRQALEAKLAQSETIRAEQVKQIAELEDTYQRFRKQTKHALSDFGEMQYKAQTAQADYRNMLRDKREKENAIADLQAQSAKLAHRTHELQETLTKVRSRLEEKEAEADLLPDIVARLQVFESQEAVHGMSFASRIAQEIFGVTIEKFLGSRRVGAESKERQAKIMADTTCARLKGLLTENDDLKEKVRRLQWEVKDTRALVPVWNAEWATDLEDAYNDDAPVHRQIFSMKDKRAFAGLGLNEDVPPYLRAEGFVRHIFVSKAELEEFMEEFMKSLLQNDIHRPITTDDMHNELFQYMKRTYDGDALIEFGYAFICSLEAYRDDPDFELFDLMLTGALHPSVLHDQQELLRSFEALLRSCCQDAGLEGDGQGGKRQTGRTASTAPISNRKEEISKRVIRAALFAIFPEKTKARFNSLVRALHMTLQALSDTTKSNNPDSVIVSDLFAATADGSQSPFIEEVRRQHFYEVIDFTAELMKRVNSGEDRDETMFRPPGGTLMVDRHQLETTFNRLDPHAKERVFDRWASIACPDKNEQVEVGEAMRRLRQGALLRPERLWITAQPRDVIFQLHNLGPPEVEAVSSTEPGGRKNGVGSIRQPRRNRAVKVLDNPMAKVHGSLYNSPEGLQGAPTRRGTTFLEQEDGEET